MSFHIFLLLVLAIVVFWAAVGGMGWLVLSLFEDAHRQRLDRHRRVMEEYLKRSQ